jgi:hypothetical protein
MVKGVGGLRSATREIKMLAPLHDSPGRKGKELGAIGRRLGSSVTRDARPVASKFSIRLTGLGTETATSAGATLIGYAE